MLKIKREIKVDDIIDGPVARHRVDQDKLEELGISITRDGVFHPLIVEHLKEKRKYRLISGKRRWLSAKEVGLSKLEVWVVEDISNEERISLFLIENLQREDLPLEDEMQYLSLLFYEYKWPIKKIAERIGKSLKYVEERIQILEMPEEIIHKVANGILPITKAALISKLPKGTQNKAIEVVEEERVTVEVLKEIVNTIAPKKKRERKEVQSETFLKIVALRIKQYFRLFYSAETSSLKKEGLKKLPHKQLSDLKTLLEGVKYDTEKIINYLQELIEKGG